jgi:ATP-binding cassette, subfamily C, bacterial PrsD
VSEAVKSCKDAFAALCLGSSIINILMLTGSLFMMQVYDRVLGSRSVPTLVALAAIAAAAYLFQGALEAMRSRMLALVGERVDETIAPKVLKAASEMPLRVADRRREALQPFRDLEAVRGGLTGSAPTALLDLPWLPIYLVVVFLLHPALGWLLVGGIAVLLAVAFATEKLTHHRIDDTQDAVSRRNGVTEQIMRGAEAVRAMGMFDAVSSRWRDAQGKALAAQRGAAFMGGDLSALAKALRYMLQSALLGFGAYLAIHGQMSAGAIIAGSIIGGRALAPVDQLISGWKTLSAARHARGRLEAFLQAFADAAEPQPLPLPTRSLEASQLAVAAPGGGRVLVRGVSFRLEAGDAVGVIGASASGKSTLTRALVGVWPAAHGAVKLDDAPISQWSPAHLGPSIGYLPQDVQLFDGTVAENIARFAPDAPMEKVMAAARAAGLHEAILSMEGGYGASIGQQGLHLSVGQRQRLGLARALYGDPFLVVMDEPNANLDPEGETAVARAIADVRLRCGIVVVVAHRPSAMLAVNLIAVMKDGALVDFGPKDEILRRMQTGPAAQRPHLKAMEAGDRGIAALRETAADMRAAGGAPAGATPSPADSARMAS